MKRNMQKNAVFSIAALLSTTLAGADTRYVAPTGNDKNSGTSWSQPYRTLQAAINAARTGDTVLAAPGAYDGDIHVTKDIVLIGNVPGGEDDAPEEDEATERAPASGTVIHGKVTIENVRSEDAEIRAITVRNGAIKVVHSAIRLETVTVDAKGLAVGLTIIGGKPVVVHSHFSGGGQGIAITHGAQVLLSRCIIEKNGGANTPQGGGLLVKESKVRVLSSQIRNNRATTGGGCFVDKGDVEFVSTLLAENAAKTGGGLFVTQGGNIRLINLTVAGNEAKTVSGIYVGAQQVRLVNSIVANNAGESLRFTPGTVITEDHNTVWQNHGLKGASTLISNPLLAGYKLTSSSQPCLDNADRGSLPPDAADEDAAGKPRVEGEGLDRGAFEYADAGEPEEEADLPLSPLVGEIPAPAPFLPVRDISTMDPFEDVLLPANRVPLPTTPATLRPLPASLWSVERLLNQHGYSLHTPSDVWEARPNIDPAELEAQHAAAYSTARSRAVDPAVWVWDKEFGSKSFLWARPQVKITHKGTKKQARVIGEAQLDGGIRKKTKKLLYAKVDLTANKTGNSTFTGRLDLLGKTVWSPSQTAPQIEYTTGKEYSQRFWSVEFKVPIVSYLVGAEAWAYGAIGMNFTANCSGGNRPTAQAVFGPYASLGIGGRAWLNLLVVKAEFEGEVALTSLVLLGANTIINGSQMEGTRWVDLEARILAGEAKIKVKGKNPFGSDPTLGTWTLWDEPNGLFTWSHRLHEDQFVKTVR